MTDGKNNSSTDRQPVSRLPLSNGHALPVADLKPICGKVTAFVCRNHVCRLPTTDPDRLSQLLTGNRQQGEPHDP